LPGRSQRWVWQDDQGVTGRIVGNGRPHRVELDVAQALQHVVIIRHQAGLVATFPQRAAAAVARIEQRHLIAPQALHQGVHGAGLWRGEQQVDMVVHQHPAMQAATAVVQCFGQQVQIGASVRIVQKAGHAIVAALNDVLGNAKKINPRLSDPAYRLTNATSVRPSADAAPMCDVCRITRCEK
jgi:hypothetical protein